MSSSTEDLCRKRPRDDPNPDSDNAKRVRDEPCPDPSDLKSLEEEISPASDSGESQPQLGYLLEASDDELGLPPPSTSSPINAHDLSQFWGFEDQFPSYEFGTGDNYTGTDEYVALEGLFDHSDVSFDSTEWRHETL